MLIPIGFIIKLKLSRSQFKNEEFIQVYGVLIENMKHRKDGIIYYLAILLLNRLVFAFIPFAFQGLPAFQVIFLQFQ